MRIVVDIIVDDLVAVANHYRTKSTSINKIKRRSTLVIGGAFMIAFALLAYVSHRPGFLIFGGIIAVLFMLLHSWRFNRSFAANSKSIYMEKNGKGILGMKELRIDEAGLFSRSNYAEATYYWHGIDDVDETDDYYFVSVGASGTIIIPKARILEGDADAFMNEVEKRWIAHTAEVEA
ncbi:MAG: YcxB family protein [Planctomycetaceae bacterium]